MFLGLAVFVYGITFSYNTGYAINPARDLGPRLFIYFIGKLFCLVANLVPDLCLVLGFPRAFSRGNDIIRRVFKLMLRTVVVR